MNRRPTALETALRSASDLQKQVINLKEILKKVEFDAKGYCLICGGWMVSENGCTPKVHQEKCPIALALK